jgi:hypothetical protein
MSPAVLEILDRIRHLPAEDRIALDEQLARQAEGEWLREAEDARRVDREQGIDQAAIDRAVEAVRYSQCRSASTPTRGGVVKKLSRNDREPAAVRLRPLPAQRRTWIAHTPCQNDSPPVASCHFNHGANSQTPFFKALPPLRIL